MNWQVSTPNQPNSLYNQGSTSGTPSAFNIPSASTSNPLSLINVASYNSIDVSMYVGDGNQGTAGHAHTVLVEFRWYDDNVSGLPVFIEDWNIWVGASIPMTNPIGALIGSLPVHGSYLSIYITNPGNAAVEVQWMTIYGSPRTVSVSDLRQNIYIPQVHDSVLHVFNGPEAGTGYDNSLLDGNVALTANLFYMFPLNMYSGPICITYQTTQALAGIYLCDVGGNDFTSGNVPSAPAGGQVWVPSSASAQGNGLAIGVYEYTGVLMPRSACAMIVKEGSTGGTLDIKIVAQQGP